jgi:hypothetical protein
MLKKVTSFQDSQNLNMPMIGNSSIMAHSIDSGSASKLKETVSKKDIMFDHLHSEGSLKEQVEDRVLAVSLDPSVFNII